MAGKKLILHIGRPKTGTSSIQHFLAANAEALAAEGAVYPRAGRRAPDRRGLRAAHHALAAICDGRLEGAAAFGAASNYNEIVMVRVGKIELRSFESFPALPRDETLEDDLLRLAALGDISEARSAIRQCAEDTSAWF